MMKSTMNPVTYVSAYATTRPTTRPKNVPENRASFWRGARMSMQTKSPPIATAMYIQTQLTSRKAYPTAAIMRMNRPRRMFSSMHGDPAGGELILAGQIIIGRLGRSSDSVRHPTVAGRIRKL